MDDGTPPPEQVRVELVCGARVIPQAYTDSKGGFALHLGQSTPQMADARSAGPASRPGAGMAQVGQAGFSGQCAVRAALPGYRSDMVNLLGKDNFDIGVLVLHRLANVEGRTISATTLAAPKDARKAYEKAGKAVEKRKWDEAKTQLEKAVGLYPRYAVAWFDLGNVQAERAELESARQAYRQSLAIDPQFVRPYMGLAEIAMREKKWQEMADLTATVVKLNRYDFPGAYAYSAMAHFNLRNLDAAEKSAREGLKVDSRNEVPKTEHVLGIILYNKGDYQGAAEHLRKYLEAAPEASDAELVKGQIARCEEAYKTAARQSPPAAPVVPR